jgi:hypothetical protein
MDRDPRNASQRMRSLLFDAAANRRSKDGTHRAARALYTVGLMKAAPGPASHP